MKGHPLEVTKRQSLNLRTALFVALMVLGVATCVGVPMFQLLSVGPFSWHVEQPTFWQGGLEALALMASVATAFALNRPRWVPVLVALAALMYLRRHAVDAGFIVDVVYLELVIGLGLWLRRLLRGGPPNGSFDYVLAFVSGFALWSVCAWTAEAIGHGSPKEIAWLTALLAIPALFAGRRPLTSHLWQRIRETDNRSDRIWCGLLVGWLLVLFARSRVAIQSDAPWYGLRSPYVLVPNHSAYEALGLTSPVHYYPKIYEIFLLPVNLLRDFSAIDGMSILMLGLLLIVCLALMRAIGTPPRAQFPMLALIATVPALANFSISPTPDVFSALFVVLAAVFSLHVVRTRAASALAWLLACVAIACSGKLTAIPFVGVLMIATAAAAIANRRPPDATTPTFDARLAWTTFGLALAAALFVLARTLWLTGLPTIGPDPLFKLWLALGFELKEPAGTLPWMNPPDWWGVPRLALDMLFRPQDLPHIVITWVGNVWLWFGLVTLLAASLGFRRVARPGVDWPLVALLATGVGVAVGNRYMVRGGDGNYFLAALVPAIVYSGTTAFSRLTERPQLFALTVALLPAFIAFQASYSFASAAWFTGTRALDANFHQSPRGTRHQRQQLLTLFGIDRIAGLLGDLPHATRVTGSVEPAVQFWLPTRYEDLATISYSRPEYLVDAARVRHLLRTQHIGYLVLPLPETKKLDELVVPKVVEQTAAELAALPGVRRIGDRRYYMLDLSGLDADVLDPPTRASANTPKS